MKVKVIFQKDWPNLAKAGEVKIVKMGFAKNFLLPQKIAILGTPQNIKRWENEQLKLQQETEKNLERLRALANLLNNRKITIQRETKEDNTLFAKIRKLEIINAFKEQIPELKNIELKKEQIELEEKIQKTGTFNIVLRLHKNIEAHIKLIIKSQHSKTTKIPKNRSKNKK